MISYVFELMQGQLILKIATLLYRQGKINFNQNTNQIVFNTFGEVENLIGLFDERYTRSDVTDIKYDTDVKMVANPTEQE